MISRAIALYGTEQVDPPMRTLRAGPLTAEFDNGALRYVRYGGIEVLRAIAFLVRDENWGTFTPLIEDLAIDETADGFTVRYRATCADAARKLVYDASITGSNDGTLAFEAVADPKTDVLTNRTGFIVLHPVDGVAGKPVTILHVDGREESATFPETIDPRCPFKDVRAMTHEIAPGLRATCTMEGDAYETEDQRNWSDASYKTYIRPLTKPWPYTLQKGKKVHQSVRLSIEGSLPKSGGASAGGAVSASLGGPIGKLPAIGIGVSAEEAVHALENRDLVKRLSPRWLVCEVDLRMGHGRAELERYRALAELTGAEVTLEIITLGTLDPAAELAPVAAAVAATGLKPTAVAVFPQQELKSVQPDVPWPPMPTFDETYAAARKAFPGVRMGGGMAAYFTELNRKRPPAAAMDYVTHTTCPNVHAADDLSVMETNEALPYQIISTRSFMGKKLPYRIGPSQLGCRENPYGKATAPNPGNGRVCLSRLDPRQRGLFNAAWTLAYVAACARGGIEALAMGAPTGPFGHIWRSADFAQPWFDEHGGPAVFPSFHLMAALGRASGATLLDTTVSRKGAVETLALRTDGGTVLWIANLTDASVSVEIPDLGANVRMAVLEAKEFERLVTSPDYLEAAGRGAEPGPLTLDAYAVARVTYAA